MFLNIKYSRRTLYYSKDEIDDLIFFNYRDHVAFSGLFHAGFYQKAESLGAFGQAEWQMTDTLRFIGGVRYTDESRDFDYTSGVTGTGAPIPVATFSDSISEDKVSGRIGIDYTPTKLPAIVLWRRLNIPPRSSALGGAKDLRRFTSLYILEDYKLRQLISRCVTEK